MIHTILFFNYPLVALVCFFFGLFGICVLKRNIIVILMALELLLFSINLLLIYFSVLYDDASAQIFAFMVLTVAAAESSIGLAILVVYYRLRGHISLDFANKLKG